MVSYIKTIVIGLIHLSTKTILKVNTKRDNLRFSFSNLKILVNESLESRPTHVTEDGH